MRFHLVSRRHLAITAVVAAVLPLAGITATAEAAAQPSSVRPMAAPQILTFANKCVDVMGGSSADGALIREWTCNGTVSQQFSIVPVSGSIVTIKTFNGKCVDLAGGNSADGTQIRQWTCNGTGSQQFSIVPTADGHDNILTSNNKCVDVAGGSSADGTLIRQWTCNGTVSQEFTV